MTDWNAKVDAWSEYEDQPEPAPLTTEERVQAIDTLDAVAADLIADENYNADTIPTLKTLQNARSSLTRKDNS
jgi:hypothetical protein